MFEKYFKTGDIAKFHNVSSDTVRYYDKEEVVGPTIIKNNRYRYYNFNDTLKFSLATRLRETGVSINQVKRWLEYDNLLDLEKSNAQHIQELECERELINKKIDYMHAFNEKLKSFNDRPNTIEYLEKDFMYICHDRSLTPADKTLGLDQFVDLSQVFDAFWSRTSFIGYINTMETQKEENEKEIFCANIIPSDCDSVRKKEFKNVLRFSYVGDINSQKTYTQEVVAKVKKYCNNHGYTLQKRFYEVYYLSQIADGQSTYYIHLYFLID